MKINNLFVLCLFFLISCNQNENKNQENEGNVIGNTPQESPVDDPSVVAEVSISQLTRNEELLLKVMTCEDGTVPFLNFQRKYLKVIFYNRVTYLDLFVEAMITNPQTLSNYSLKFNSDGTYFTILPGGNVYGQFPTSALDDLPFLETIQLKTIEPKKAIFETSLYGQLCSLSFDRVTVMYINDTDRDGFDNDVDCNPNNSAEFRTQKGYLDADRDGYGVRELVEFCTGSYPNTNYTFRSGDCDDTNSAVRPNANEIMFDGIDNNCDGTGI